MDCDPLFNISGKIVLVTGAAGGIGREVVQALAARGASVILTDLDGERAARAAAACGGAGHVTASTLDICNEVEVDAAVGAVLEQHGRIDGLVNCAGIYRTAPITELSAQAFRDTIEINLTAAFLLTRAAARAMAGGGRILHLASVSSTVSNPDYAAYASSKAGLSHLARVAARELAPRGITVNAIGPAVTETDLTAKHLEDPEYRANAIAHIPMGRLGQPQDILATVILLLSPGGVFITGQTIYVDGGRTLV